MKTATGRLQQIASWLGAVVLLALVGSLALNILARIAGLPLVGANLVAAWLLPVLAFLTLGSLVPDARCWRSRAAALVSGFAIGALGLGMALAATRIGGTEPVIGVPVAWRFGVGATLCGAALLMAVARGPATALTVLLGAAVAMVPLPPLPFSLGFIAFALALAAKTPVPLALLAAVAVSPGTLSEAALAQSVMRGLSGYVLLAVPLFILAAALLVAGGVGTQMVAAARALAQRRASGLGEANVAASLLFGGVSASSVADAATGARLLVPPMVASGYPKAKAAAITAASAVLPNVMPPSIALLLAAAATDISVGKLWVAGAIAAPVLAGGLLLAVRLTAPSVPEHLSEQAGPKLRLKSLVLAISFALVLLAALRLGFVTAVEAGVVAALLAAIFSLRAQGLRATGAACASAANQAGRVGLLIAAAAPVGFLIAAEGFDVSTLLPPASPFLTLIAAIAVCLLVGTVLDVGAAILLMLPMMLPAVAASGVEPVHGALVLTTALLLGGLTPPVGILILVVKEITGAVGVYRAATAYLLSLFGALLLIAAAPLLLRAAGLWW